MAVSHINNQYCDKAITAEFDGTGRIQSATLAGCDTPNLSLQFAEFDGMWLANRRSLGEADFWSLAWARQALKQPDYSAGSAGGAGGTGGGGTSKRSDTPIHQWFLTQNDLQSQAFEYNEQGLISKETIKGAVTEYRYQNNEHFATVPIEIKDNNGNLRQIDLSKEQNHWQLAVSAGDDPSKAITRYSQSGTLFQQQDLLGLRSGSTGSKSYLPSGGMASVDGSRATLKLGLDDKAKELGVTIFNRWGEVVGTERLAYQQQIVRDPLGRVTKVRENQGRGDLLTVGYRYLGNRLQVSYSDLETNTNWSERYDERGLLREMTMTSPVAQQVSNRYDVLGRLTTEMLTQGGTTATTSYQYFEDTSILERVTLPQGIVHEMNPQQTESGVAIDGRKLTIDSQTNENPTELTPDGKTTKTEVAGVGQVEMAHDGWALETTVKQDGKLLHQTTYEDKKVVVEDQIAKIIAQHEFEQDGLKQKVVQSGEGLDTPQSYETELTIEGDHLVQIIRTAGREHKRYLNGKGKLDKLEYGDFVAEVRARNDGGRPQTLVRSAKEKDGESVTELDYDNNQRITRLTDGNGNTVSATYNDRGLLETYTDARGLVHRLSYLDDAPIVSRMVAETTNRKGENPTVLFERGTAGVGTGGSGGGIGGQAKAGGLLNFTAGDWLGRKQAIATSIAENNQSVQITENGATATTTIEEGVGTIDGIVNQVGERTTVEHDNYGLVTRVRGADGASRQITLDGLGQLREIHEKGVRTTRVHRDNQGRVSRVRTPQRQVEMSYDESAQAISRMTGGRYPVEYRDFNHLGQAQMVDVNDRMLQIKLEYFDGGALRCLTETRMGQLPNQYHYNSLGDLIEIKRAHQKPVNFSYNNWGSVDTMTYGDRSYSVFGSGGEQKMSLPGDVSADVDERGRLKEILRPGLALKELTYDAADRLDQVIIGGVILRDYDYRDGKLDRLQVVAANGGVDLYRYQFDEDGRMTAIERNGEPYVSWTYPDLQTLRQASTNSYADPDRMLTYTDPNGVEHRYTYDQHGYISQIDLTDGPSFHYTYDGAGNLLRLQSMGLSITYENWQRGMPQAMTWGDGTRFEITRDGADNLDTITSNDGVYLLDLDWEDQPGGEGCGAGGTHQKELKRITRQAGTFSEVLEPDYDTDNHLTETTITRTDNGQTTTITEQYGPVTNQLLAGLTRILNGTVIIEEQMTLDETADRRRIASATGTAGQTNQTGTDTYIYDESLGNLNRIERRDGTIRTFVWDGFRRLLEIRDNNTILASYDYDNQYRRVRATSSRTTKPLAYAYQNSKVIAIGQIEATGQRLLDPRHRPRPAGPSLHPRPNRLRP